MNSYKSSTKKQPIFFFETFLNKESLAAYKDHFYKDYINPSQKKNLSQGYIEYNKDYYENEESLKVIEYFEVRLKNLLEREAKVSYRLLYERKLAKEYDEVFKNDFINHRISDLDIILERAKKLSSKDLIISILNKLREKMNQLRYPSNPIPFRSESKTSIGSENPYFGLKFEIRKRHLKKFYHELVIIDMIDNEDVSENNFLAVFTSSNPSLIDDNIIFNKDNYHVMALFQFLEPYFDQLKHSRIDKSKSFFSKNAQNPMSQTSLDTNKHRFKSKDISEYKIIQDAILRAMP